MMNRRNVQLDRASARYYLHIALLIFFCCWHLTPVKCYTKCSPERDKPPLTQDQFKQQTVGKRGISPWLVPHGTEVIPAPKVFSIYWSSSVAYQATLIAFVSNIVRSSYVDWLCEYSVPNRTIGRGSFLGSTVIGSTSKYVTYSTIVNTLPTLIDSSQIPVPDDDTLFILFFDRDTTITSNLGEESCKPNSFCGYHSIFIYNNTVYPFAVIADCASGCGNNQLDALTGTTSHEMVESITDRFPGRGWYDDVNGQEAADLCPYLTTYHNRGNSWTVNAAWSNNAGSCVTSVSSPTCSQLYAGPSSAKQVTGSSHASVLPLPSYATCLYQAILTLL